MLKILPSDVQIEAEWLFAGDSEQSERVKQRDGHVSDNKNGE